MTNGMAWNVGRLKTQRNVDGFIRKRIYRKLIILLSNMNRKTDLKIFRQNCGIMMFKKLIVVYPCPQWRQETDNKWFVAWLLALQKTGARAYLIKIYRYRCPLMDIIFYITVKTWLWYNAVAYMFSHDILLNIDLVHLLINQDGIFCCIIHWVGFGLFCS